MVDEPGPLSEEELVERLQEEMRKITVTDYLTHLLVSLSSMAFQRLGLMPETVAERDLVQARMAIDAFEALANVLSGKVGDQDAAMYRSTVHQMRMAYVRASDAGAGGAEPGAAEASANATEVGASDADENQAGTPVEEKE
ncbi:MAG: DUF1844 domain-containing protein [Actinobacteria bacterium]|nr:DUF1844 domain-containing protein [Actinomycetota bacterium]